MNIGQLHVMNASRCVRRLESTKLHEARDFLPLGAQLGS